MGEWFSAKKVVKEDPLMNMLLVYICPAYYSASFRYSSDRKGMDFSWYLDLDAKCVLFCVNNELLHAFVLMKILFIPGFQYCIGLFLEIDQFPIIAGKIKGFFLIPGSAVLLKLLHYSER